MPNRPSPLAPTSTFYVTLLCALLVTLSLTGCSTMGSWFGFGEEEVHVPAEQLAAEGMERYNVGDYHKAAKHFTELLEKYPFSPQAVIAELKGADCQYFMGNYPEALAMYQRFEDKYPSNEAMPYVMYQIAMCSYQQIDTIDRDISGATRSIRDFTRLLKAYPDSPYTDEARARIKAANEFLVNHEYLVVEFYLRTDRHLAAKTRLKYLINHYPDASVTPQARILLAKLEAGEEPGFNLAAWFSSLVKLPDWKLFSSEKTGQ